MHPYLSPSPASRNRTRARVPAAPARSPTLRSTAAVLLLCALVAAPGLLAPPLAAQATRGLQAEDRSGDVSIGRYRALLIAAEEYGDPALAGLENPVTDAAELREVLVHRYRFDADDVELLTNPTRDQIIGRLYALSQDLGRDDNLLLFFAGHGFWDERSQQGYWLPVDASRDQPGRWISNADLRDALRRIDTQHTLLITDACFAGGIFVTRDAFGAGTGMARLYATPSRKAMTSGARETVPDRSRFLEYLVQNLAENPDPVLPAADLFTRLRTAVMNNSPVTPQYGTIYDAGDEGGEFLFVLRDADAAALEAVTRPAPAGPPIASGSAPDPRAGARAATERVAWSVSDAADALAGVDVDALELALRGGVEPALLVEALGREASDGRSVAIVFFERSKGRTGAVEWLARAVASGLDPNATVPGDGYEREGLLHAAVRAGNAAAVLALVEGGASPHAYQALWFTPWSLPRFVFPFKYVVEHESFSADEKGAIVRAFLDHGGIIPGLDSLHPRNQGRSQTAAVRDLPAEARALAGIELGPTAPDRGWSESPVCRFATERDGFDWCAFVDELPNVVTVRSGERMYHDFWHLELLGLLNVVDGKAYLLGLEKETNLSVLDVVEVSRDARLWRVYRYMHPGAGMGHCLEQDGFRPEECWRRISMRYDPEQATMRVEDYYTYATSRTR